MRTHFYTHTLCFARTNLTSNSPKDMRVDVSGNDRIGRKIVDRKKGATRRGDGAQHANACQGPRAFRPQGLASGGYFTSCIS